jgi:hypothetical protein
VKKVIKNQLFQHITKIKKATSVSDPDSQGSAPKVNLGDLHLAPNLYLKEKEICQLSRIGAFFLITSII